MASTDQNETTQTQQQRTLGRYRNVRSHRAILDATNQLLAEVGYARLTIEGVAARAGVGKATVYRWWPSKGALVVDALSENPAVPPAHDTGSVRTDLEQAIEYVIGVLTTSPEGSIIPALAADLVHDPVLAETFRTRLLRPRRSVVEQMMHRAVERGELPPDTDASLILDICVGAVFYRLVVSGEPVGEALAARLVDLVLDGISSRPAAPPGRTRPGRAARAPGSSSRAPGR
jgi:AcrR family transcriptional regulator